MVASTLKPNFCTTIIVVFKENPNVMCLCVPFFSFFVKARAVLVLGMQANAHAGAGHDSCLRPVLLELNLCTN